MAEKPKVNSAGEQELAKAEKQFEAFDASVKQMTKDRMDATPPREHEPLTKLSQKDIEKSNDIYIKPDRTLSVRDKFNEDYRTEWNFQKEYVQFIAEHKEIIGETIDIWTRPFGGVPAEYWKVPPGKPVWGPRYLAEQIKRKRYHRLTMQENKTIGSDGMGQYYGSMAVDTTVQRLDAHPVVKQKSVFMGANSFA